MTATQELLDICRHHLDPRAEPIAEYAGHEQTNVLRASTSAGEVIVKIHRSPERHERELHAYKHWVPSVADRAPRLLAGIDDPPAIIITALAGHPLTETNLSAEQELDVYRRAGALLRAWHDAEPPRDTPNMTAWLAERGEQWLQIAEPVLPADERAEIRAHLRDLAALGALPAVPCHLDFTPRNLIYNAHGQVSMIDFEHARFDLPARDLVRLAARYWYDRPDLEDAFLSDYGQLSDLDRTVIEHCTYLDAVTSAVRATGRRPPPSTTA